MNNLIPTLKYLWLTIRYKIYVFRAGLKTGAAAPWACKGPAPIWRLLIHDLSKFTPKEVSHYVRYFSGEDPDGYNRIRNHHAKSNPHHWEYWVPLTGGYCGEDLKPLPMPMWAVRLMVADWCGASKAYDGFYPWELMLFDDWRWFRNNWPKMEVLMHDDTLKHLEEVMNKVFGIRGSKLFTHLSLRRK